MEILNTVLMILMFVTLLCMSVMSATAMILELKEACGRRKRDKASK